MCGTGICLAVAGIVTSYLGMATAGWGKSRRTARAAEQRETVGTYLVACGVITFLLAFTYIMAGPAIAALVQAAGLLETFAYGPPIVCLAVLGTCIAGGNHS